MPDRRELLFSAKTYLKNNTSGNKGNIGHRNGFTLLETLLATLILTTAAIALLPLQRSLLQDPLQIQTTSF